MPLRITRSQSRALTLAAPANLGHTASSPTTIKATPDTLSISPQIAVLPSKSSTRLTSLGSDDLAILKKKQVWLQKYKPSIPAPFSNSSSFSHDAISLAVSASLVFAQYEAGTAICISASGLLLTCSHCIAESVKEVQGSNKNGQFLLFASGRVVKTECVAWDAKRDLAILKIVTAQAEAQTGAGTPEDFPFISISQVAPTKEERLLCIGHPGSEDLEVSDPGVPTNYDVLHVSDGRFRGYAEGQDVFDNSEIGALMHDCWTYWGHSGAPLINVEGKLVGLHSSWDDETAMRRGIGWECLKAFMNENMSRLEAS